LEAFDLLLRLAAAPCGKALPALPYRAPPPLFPEAQPQEKILITEIRKGGAFPQCAAASRKLSCNFVNAEAVLASISSPETDYAFRNFDATDQLSDIVHSTQLLVSATTTFFLMLEAEASAE